MIQSYTAQNGKVLYKVRVFTRSNTNPNLRVTRQEGGIESEEKAKKVETSLKRECERELAALEAQGILFGDLIEDWYEHTEKLKVASGQITAITHRDNLGGIQKWFGDYWRKPTSELNPFVVSGIFEAMKDEELSFAHRRKLKRVLKTIFDFGIQSGQLPMLARSPTFEVILKRDEEKKPEILTLQQIQTLIKRAFEDGHDWRRVWTVALLTGMRSGEIYALTWKDVDWENNLINVNKSYNARMRDFKSTKAGYWRQVPISQDLVQILKDQHEETGGEERVFRRCWEWDRGLQANVLRRFCYIQGLPSVKFHTLRACFATQMLRSGVEAAKVMKICGWKQLKTMQHYVRLAGIEVQGVTEALKYFPEKMIPNQREGSAIAGPSFLALEKESNSA
ncbi:MAG: tyrosine-type recombinase/integrase [Bdellovibrionota bacterium]